MVLSNTKLFPYQAIQGKMIVEIFSVTHHRSPHLTRVLAITAVFYCNLRYQ